MSKGRNRITDLIDGLGQHDMLTLEQSEQLKHANITVENIAIGLIRPDPAQPRRIFPEDIYTKFHTNRFTPAQALREFIQRVQIIARQNGRQFFTILDLLPNPDESDDIEPVQLTPEEILLRDLINLAVTMRDDGQVNPLTVVDCSEGVTRKYRIETGERRYWAAHIVQDFLPGYEGNGSVPCIIVPQETASFLRQARENTARSGLNAIAMARQAALLILSAHGIYPPEGPVSNAFYCQVLDYDLRGKREFTDEILSAMGGIDKRRLHQYKSLLKLSDEAIEVADRHSIDEGKLRHVVRLPQEFHLEVVRQIVDFNLNAKQVKALCEQSDEKEEEVSSQEPPRYAKKFAQIIMNPDERTIADFLKALEQTESNPEVLKIKIERFITSVIEGIESLHT